MLLDPALKVGKECLSLLGSPAMSTYCPWEATFSCPDLSDKLHLTKEWSTAVLFVVCFSPRAQLSQTEKLFLLLVCIALFGPCVLSSDPATCGSYSYKANQNCWITHPARSRNHCPDRDIHLVAEGEFRTKYLPGITPFLYLTSKGHMFWCSPAWDDSQVCN